MSEERKRERMFLANQKSGYTPWVQGALKEWNIEWSPLSLHFASCCAMLKLLLVLGCCQLLPAGMQPYGAQRWPSLYEYKLAKLLFI